MSATVTSIDRKLVEKQYAVELTEELSRWSRVLEAEEDCLDSRLRVIEILTELERNDEVARQYELAAPFHAEDLRFTVPYARHLLRSGATADAIEWWSRIERVRPSDVEALNNLGFLFLRAGNPDEALRRAEQLEELDAGRACQLRIRSLIQSGRHEEAMTEIEADRVADSTTSMDTIELASLFTRFENHEIARSLLASEEDRVRSDPAVAALYLRVLQRLGHHAEASAVLNELPRSVLVPRLRKIQAEVLISLSQFEDADSVCMSALQEDPDNVDLLKLYARSAQARFASERAA